MIDNNRNELAKIRSEEASMLARKKWTICLIAILSLMGGLLVLGFTALLMHPNGPWGIIFSLAFVGLAGSTYMYQRDRINTLLQSKQERKQ
jgi:uncharacterized YccA/Bax inhibitor family protein